MGERTFGTLARGHYTRYKGEERIKVPAFAMQVEPHVSMWAKRVFPRIQQTGGMLHLDDLPPIARDIEWFLTRYPLDMDEKCRKYLNERANLDRDREQQMLAILEGVDVNRADKGWLVPARPGREYQTQGADLAHNRRGMLLGDDLGLGKTQTAVMLLRDPETRPALIVVPTDLPWQWQDEIAEIFPTLNVHILKKRAAYDLPPDVDVVISNYAKLDGWRDHLAGKVRTVIFDEVQTLRTGVSAQYHAAKHIADEAVWRLGLSATPVYNYGGETHTIFNVLAPGELGSRQEFIDEWGGTTVGTNSNNISLKDPKALGSYLRSQGLLVRRKRAEVGRELPEPLKLLQEVPASHAVMESIKGDVQALAEIFTNPSATALEKMRAAGDMDYKMRHATGVAKAPAVAEFVRLLLQSEDKIVLAGWHHDVYALWADMLSEFNPVMFHGKATPLQKRRNVLRFRDDPDCRVMAMSLRSGAGLEGLQQASKTVVFGELDWAPPMHDQLIGRLAREGAIGEVTAHFCVTMSGSDPVMAKVLNVKGIQSESIRNPDVDDAMFAPNLGTQDKARSAMLLDAVRRL